MQKRLMGGGKGEHKKGVNSIKIFNLGISGAYTGGGSSPLAPPWACRGGGPAPSGIYRQRLKSGVVDKK